MTIVKGKALRQDFAQYDGITLTGSRKDSTGGFISGLRVGDEVDVLMVYGQGENYNNQTIQNAITSIASKNVTLKFTPGTWAINADVTIPSNLSVNVPAGVVFNVASGKTLTFQGPVFRDSETWTSGSGTVTETWSRSESGSVTFNGTVTFGGSLVGLRVTNLQALRDAAASILSVGAAFALGHTTAGDGGHGQFRYVSGASAGTYTDDDGITIVPTGGNGSAAWLRVYSGPINVKWYGATGDGSTNDATAINSAATAATGGALYFPEPSSSYLLGAIVNIPANTKVIGEGFGTVLKKGFNGDLINLGKRSSIESIYFDGNKATYTGRGVIIDTGDNTATIANQGHQRIIRCAFVNFSGYPVEYTTANKGWMSRVEKCWFYGSNSDACVKWPDEAASGGNRNVTDCYSDIPIVNAGGCDNGIISKNSVGGSGGASEGVIFPASTTNRAKKVIITNNRFAIASGTIQVRGTDIVFDENIIAGSVTFLDNSASDGASSCIYNAGNKITGTFTDSSLASNEIFLTNPVSFTPTWTAITTNPDFGNADVRCEYVRYGTYIKAKYFIKFGSTSTYGSGAWKFSLPISRFSASLTTDFVGHAYLDGAVGTARSLFQSSEDNILLYTSTGGNVNATTPITWASGDILIMNIEYRVI